MARARIRGDFKKLDAWAQALKDAPEALSDMSANMAEEAIELIRQGFEKEQDPYGRPWKPLQEREGRILQDTGRLRNSFHRVSSGKGGFTVASGADYGGFHQSGTRYIPARKMVPDAGRLPTAWARAFRDVAVQALERHIARASKGAGRDLLTGKLVGLKRRFNALAIIRRAFRAIEGGHGG